eukprot:CAMPEP_0179016926 /NCGR_PEP_ID=MMETSP0796-20121207/3578_1 /TAXON_ID=73915 /ORGANISM="Pyrodinium bahamense, Strain pbaha01" /LENGTH=119 /DNA_ID=CAMNT_0020712645 /DNA_START=226 /DNA_END=581 /DNA_ORIENTATION=-
MNGQCQRSLPPLISLVCASSSGDERDNHVLVVVSWACLGSHRLPSSLAHLRVPMAMDGGHEGRHSSEVGGVGVRGPLQQQPGPADVRPECRVAHERLLMRAAAVIGEKVSLGQLILQGG